MSWHWHIAIQILDHETQGVVLIDAHGFIDAVCNIKKLTLFPAEYTQPSNIYGCSGELFTPISTFNYEDFSEYPEVINYLLPLLRDKSIHLTCKFIQ